MAFNVCDKHGKHIGIVHKRFPISKHGTPNSVLVGITDKKLIDSDINLLSIKDFIATGYDCKTILGRIKEEKLAQVLKDIWEKDYSYLGPFNDKLLLKILLIQRKLEYNESIAIDSNDLYGYILLRTDTFQFYDETTILIHEELDYIDYKERYSGIAPTYFKATSSAIIHLSVIGLAEGLMFASIGDLGGRNHTHHTKISLLSGNITQTLEFPIQLYIKKDMPVTIYIESERIKAVLFDDILYTF